VVVSDGRVSGNCCCSKTQCHWDRTDSLRPVADTRYLFRAFSGVCFLARTRKFFVAAADDMASRDVRMLTFSVRVGRRILIKDPHPQQ